MGKEIIENGISPIESIGPKTKMTMVIDFYSWCPNLWEHNKERRRSEGGRVLKNSDNSRIFEKTLLEKKK
jgi:hypothetical protein